MLEDNVQKQPDRRRRVLLIKRMIISLIITSILVPIVLCIILFCRFQSMSKHMGSLVAQVEELTQGLQKSQDQWNALSKQLEEGMATMQIVENRNKQLEETKTNADPRTPQTIKEPAHKVYLTFDDGPSIYTEDILDILERYGVKATFFVVGKENDNAKETMCRIVEEGHTLGMHSYSHKYNDIYSSVEEFAEDFTRLRDYIYEVTGIQSEFYRFPGGSSNKVSSVDMKLLGEYLQEENIVFYDWNISSGDASSKMLEVDTIVKNCLEGIEERKTSVILMHDAASKSTTVEALPIIIENILAIEDTVILPITDETEPVQHIKMQ